MRWVQHPLCRTTDTAYLEHYDLASLLRRPKCQHGELHLFLSRRSAERTRWNEQVLIQRTRKSSEDRISQKISEKSGALGWVDMGRDEGV